MTLTDEISAGFNIQRTFQEALWIQNPLLLKYNKLLKNLLKACYGPVFEGKNYNHYKNMLSTHLYLVCFSIDLTEQVNYRPIWESYRYLVHN